MLQESLTNAGRHGSGPVLVRLDHDATGSTITVRNTRAAGDRATGAPAQRHGLVGMTERVAASGGTLRVGPEGPHWVVSARLPAQPADTRTGTGTGTGTDTDTDTGTGTGTDTARSHA